MKTSIQWRMPAQKSWVLERKLLTLLLIVLNLFSKRTTAQGDSLIGFNQIEAIKHLSNFNSEKENENLYLQMQRNYLQRRYNYYEGQIKQSENTSLQKEMDSNCDNIDFEKNAINGWNVNGDYEIVSNGIDSFGRFPVVFPAAGKYSLKLNNPNLKGKNKFVANITRTMHVTPKSSFFNLHFAMVILNFPHDSSSAARFKVRLIDASGVNTFCPKYNCYYSTEAGAVGINTFSLSGSRGKNTLGQDFEVSYSPWQSVGIDLSAYMNKDITIEISCDWCIFNVDWAYCYIDADCSGIAVPMASCVKFPVVLNAPNGFLNFKWFGPNNKQSVSVLSSFVTNVSGIYTLQCNQTKGCDQLPFTYIYSVKEGPKSNFEVKTRPCNLNVIYKPLNVSVVDTALISYIWRSSDGNVSTNDSVVQHQFQTPGKKWVQLTVSNKNLCKDTSMHTFVLSAPVNFKLKMLSEINLLTYDQTQVEYLAFNTNVYGALKYECYSDGYYSKGAKMKLEKEGYYNVIVTDSITHCYSSEMFYINIETRIPDVFTPNQDEVNDSFKFRISNTNNIETVIYDRWGNKVFDGNSNDGNVLWDGKNKSGLDCAEGVFYYVVQSKSREGEANTKHGVVSLFR